MDIWLLITLLLVLASIHAPVLVPFNVIVTCWAEQDSVLWQSPLVQHSEVGISLFRVDTLGREVVRQTKERFDGLGRNER